MELEWYPGHMTKARRQMEADLKLVDLIIEICDARIPISSRNPDLKNMGQGRLRLIVLNKADLADPKATDDWIKALSTDTNLVVACDSKNPGTLNKILQAIDQVSKPKRERDLRRGIKNRPVRAMIVGIPNVGKSTFINMLCKKSQAKTGNKPGVTRGKQWLHASKTLDLLDTPGVLWPKFEDARIGEHLAMCGAISDERIIMEELSTDIIRFLEENYSGIMEERFGIKDAMSEEDIIRTLAKNRGFLLPGNAVDRERTARTLVREFREGVLGRISLEFCNNEA